MSSPMHERSRDLARGWMETSSDPRRLASLFKPAKKLYSSSELGGILKHLLASPLQFHWAELNTRLAQALTDLPAHERRMLNTFGELLDNPRPPGSILLLLKDYAKGMLKQPEALLPEKLARALYFTAIAAGKVHGIENITELDEKGIRQGVEWALQQEWLGEPCRRILKRALR